MKILWKFEILIFWKYIQILNNKGIVNIDESYKNKKSDYIIWDICLKILQEAFLLDIIKLRLFFITTYIIIERK